jgi:hypothetical protein
VVTDLGCASAPSAVVDVTVNPIPTATITPDGPLTFCAGEDVVLDAGLHDSYLWSPNGETTQAITVTVGGSYSVVVTDLGCASAPSAVVNVTVNPLPVVTGLTVADINACLLTGVTITWTVQPSTTYELSVDNGPPIAVTSPWTYTPGNPNSHNYKVRGTALGCMGAYCTEVAGIDRVSAAPTVTTDNTAADVDTCAYSGNRITWPVDPAAWNDTGATGNRTYTVYRGINPIATNIAYGTTQYIDAGALPNVSYAYYVEYTNMCGLSDATPLGATAMDVNNTPAAPTGLAVTDNGACTNGVTITWNSVGGLTYELSVDGGVGVPVTTPWSYTPGDTNPHNYQIRAREAGGCYSAYCTAVNATDVNNTPAVPTGLAVADVNVCAQSGVTVTWTAVGGLTYELSVDGGVGVPVTTPWPYNSGDTNPHNYQIRAQEAGGCYSAYCTAVNATDGNNTPPQPAISLIEDVNPCVVSNISITFSFTAGRADLWVDGFEIQQNVTSPLIYNPGGTATRSYVIRAVNGTCFTDSAPYLFADLVSSAPNVVVNNTAADADVCADTGVRVTWQMDPGAAPGSDAAWNDASATGNRTYAVYRNLTQIASTIAYGTTEYTDNGGANGTSYTYYVRYTNKCGLNASTSPGTAATDLVNAPAVPTGLTVTDDGACTSGVTITWNTVGGLTYELSVDSGVGFVVTTPYAYTPVDANPHNYQIRAKEAGGCYSAYCTAVNATDVNNMPVVPADLAVVDINACASDGLNITWTVEAGITYDLYVDGTTIVPGVTSPHVELPGDADPHSYQIRANAAGCTSGWSSAVGGTDANDMPTTAPVITGITDIDPLNQTGIQIFYTAAGAPVTRHDLYRDGLLVATAYVSGATYIPGDSNPHQYYVKAVNGTCFADSNQMSGTDEGVMLPPPPVPDNGVVGGVAARFIKNTVTPDTLDVTYSTSCTADHAAILYGALGNFGAYTGCAQSDGGSTGITTIDSASQNNVWYNIVWVNATTGGHPGFTSMGARTLSAAGFCGIALDDHSHTTCP